MNIICLIHLGRNTFIQVLLRYYKIFQTLGHSPQVIFINLLKCYLYVQ